MAVMTGCPGCGQQYQEPPRSCGDCGTRLTGDRIDEPTETMVPAGRPRKDGNAATGWRSRMTPLPRSRCPRVAFVARPTSAGTASRDRAYTAGARREPRLRASAATAEAF